jgi:hypothetical protein
MQQLRVGFRAAFGLLPRISRFGGWAPLINTVLFSLYHFFTPWQLLGRRPGD